MVPRVILYKLGRLNVTLECENCMLHDMTCRRAVITIYYFIICVRSWENPPYGIHARFVQCAFLVAQVEICRSPDFVISMHVKQPFF
jgi:predicted RNA methylase